MKKSIIIGWTMVLSTLLLSACGEQETLGQGMSADSQQVIEEQTEASLEIHPISLDIVESEEASGQMMFGSLRILPPTGWKIESRENEEGYTECVLVDAHSDSEDETVEAHHPYYKHDVIITPYEIKEWPESQEAVMAGLMEYLGLDTMYSCMKEDTIPEDNMWLAKGYDEKKAMECYMMLSTSREGMQQLFVIAEPDSAAYANDVEEFMYDWWEQNAVLLDDGLSGIYRQKPESNGEEYFILRQGNEVFSLARIDRKDEEHYLDIFDSSDYEQSIYQFTLRAGHGDLLVTDINEDGFDDFLLDEYEPWLEEGQELMGALWSPEEHTFIEYSQAQLKEKYPEAFATPKELAAEEDKIPQSLKDMVSQVLVKDRETIAEVMGELVFGRELTEEEVKALADKSPCIDRDFQMIISDDWSEGTWIMVDADNDGIEDVYLHAYLGGSMGLTYYYLYKGQEDGTYEKYYVGNDTYQEFAFISWEGKNYMTQTTFDYGKKEYDGIYLTAYKDGQVCDEVWLQLTKAEGENIRHRELVYLAEEVYREELAEPLLHFDHNYERYEQPTGTAEIYGKGELKNWVFCDMDNDGEDEIYYKYTWTPSNMSTYETLVLQSDEEAFVEELHNLFYEDDGVPLLMWVDESQWGNLIYVLYEDSLYDFHISVYKGAVDGYEKLVQVNHQIDLTVVEGEIWSDYS